MESPKDSTSPKRVSFPVREEDIIESFPVVQLDEDSDSPKEPPPPAPKDEISEEELSAMKFNEENKFEEEARSISPVSRDENVVRNSSPVMGNSPVIESSNPTWKNSDSGRGSLPPSPGLEVATEEETSVSYGKYSNDSDHQDEALSLVTPGEKGATRKTYGVDSGNKSHPGTSREEEAATGNTYAVPEHSDEDSHLRNESSLPMAGREEEEASAGKLYTRLMTLSDEENHLPERSFSPEPDLSYTAPPQTFSDEERDYKEEFSSSVAKKEAVAVGAYPIDDSDDSESERGSYRPRENDTMERSPVAMKAPPAEETSPVIDTPSPRIGHPFDVESDVERVPPAAPRLKPAVTARGNQEPVENNAPMEEKASPVTPKPDVPSLEKAAAKRKEWAVVKKASAKANEVVNNIMKHISHIRGDINRVRGNARKDILTLQSYQPTFDAAQAHRAAESAAMTSALFLITLYIVLLSIIYRLIATSYLPFLNRFVF